MAITQVPKAELHCHSDGILSPEMARRIRDLYPDFLIDPEALARGYPVTDLKSFFAWYDHVGAIDRNLTQYAWVLEQYIQQQIEQNVRYLEIFLANGEIPHDPGEAVEAMQIFRESINRYEAGKIQVELVVTLGRSKSVEVMQSFEPKVLALHEAGLIVGAALAGPEIGNPASKYKSTFRRFHEAGIPIEIHAGEWVGPESIRDALEHCHPTRIGHGVTLFDDPQLIERFQEQQIHIEMCPTSNLKTGSVTDLKDHPVQQARELGLNFSINTDDPGIFECNMNSEYAILSELFGFGEADWLKIYQDTMAARFQPILRVPNEVDESTQLTG